MRFVDLHSHILPGVDDGARTLADTIEMLRLAQGSGTIRIVATPHMFHPGFGNNDPEDMRLRFEETQKALLEKAKEERFEFLQAIQIELGAENFMSSEFLESVSTHDVLTLADGRYLLVEPPWTLPWTPLKSVLERILSLDLVPVLAHVERYSVFRNSPELLDRVLEMGCLTQVNAAALQGGWLSVERRFLLSLFRQGRVSILASDGHNATNRTPQLDKSAMFLERKFGAELARRWTLEGPSWVFDDRRTASADASLPGNSDG